MGRQKIFILENHKHIGEIQCEYLEDEGYEVNEFEEAISFLEALKEDRPDLVLLNIMFPGIDGIEVCKAMKNDPDLDEIPIIMVTAKNDTTDKIVDLELGADDYIVRPFNGKELVARVKSLIGRLKRQGRLIKRGYSDDLITIDRQNFHIVVDGEKVELTRKEFSIIELLSEEPYKIFPRSKILKNVWGETFITARTIDVHIRHLREKMGKASHYLKNIRGAGYTFFPPEE